MITKMEYAEKIAAKVNGEVRVVKKNNDVEKIGIIRRPEGSNISPCVYIDAFYEEEKSIDEAANEVDGVITQNMPSNFDAESLLVFYNIKTKLRAKLINEKTTCEVFRSAENVGFPDLIIVPYIADVLPNSNGIGISSIKVTQSLLERWNKTSDEIIDIALENSAKDVDIQSMLQMLMEFGVEPDFLNPADEREMFVITNASRVNGAISVLFAREKLKVLFPNGYTVLPSSIHEVIVTSLVNKEELEKMVQEINATQVVSEEQLSDRVYLFK